MTNKHDELYFPKLSNMAGFCSQSLLRSDLATFTLCVVAARSQRYLKPPRLPPESSQVSLRQEIADCLCNSSGFE